MSPTPELGLYVHLPLCPARCPYCDFLARSYSTKEARLIEEGLLGHLGLLAGQGHKRKLASLYLGGGTPSLWPAGFTARLIERVDACLGLSPGAEVSLEANPGTLSPAKLKALRQAGVNRLSLGAQSFDDGLLGVLGRRHRAEQTRRAVAWARQAGFSNLSLDLIYGLPGQSRSRALADVRAALELSPDHLSLYELTLSPETPFGRRYQKGRPPLPPEDELAQWEQASRELVTKAGLERYEVSNFARPGLACRHNQATWRGEDYQALGPGAHGHLAGRRWALVADAGRYLSGLQAGREPFEFCERLSPSQRAAELFILGLRTVRGVDLAGVGRVLGEDPRKAYAAKLAHLRELGWARIRDGFLRPSPLGLDMADSAAELFI